MADGRHLEKCKNRHISAVVWPISMKFRTMTQLDLLTVLTVQNLKFQKSKIAATAILKNRKSPYLRNGLTDLREICHGDAYWASEPDRKLKFPTFNKKLR